MTFSRIRPQNSAAETITDASIIRLRAPTSLRRRQWPACQLLSPQFFPPEVSALSAHCGNHDAASAAAARNLPCPTQLACPDHIAHTLAFPTLTGLAASPKPAKRSLPAAQRCCTSYNGQCLRLLLPVHSALRKDPLDLDPRVALRRVRPPMAAPARPRSPLRRFRSDHGRPA